MKAEKMNQEYQHLRAPRIGWDGKAYCVRASQAFLLSRRYRGMDSFPWELDLDFSPAWIGGYGKTEWRPLPVPLWPAHAKTGEVWEYAVMHDHDTSPREFDCYSVKDIKAWENDEWCYVGIMVRCYSACLTCGLGAERNAEESSLWGIDYRPDMGGDECDRWMAETLVEVAAECEGEDSH